MNVLKELPNQEIWKNFELLNAIPRASKKEERVIAFMKKWGEDKGLVTAVDKVGNVIIKKNATNGYENAPVVILQSHLDMVHQKNADTKFDFDSEGIQMYVDGDWVRARGTTLGADNGLGVAAIMAILESDNIQHPPLEALFTIDEETGMTGAKGLESGWLDGKILLNLDTEDDHHIDIGCAGGIDVTAQMKYDAVPVQSSNFYKISITGLSGGHSGMEIHKGLGNANKIMNRVLYSIHEQSPIELISIDGGGLRNAIPRESVAVIAGNGDVKNNITAIVENIKAEFKTVEKNLKIEIIDDKNAYSHAVPSNVFIALLRTIYAAHNGVYRMSADFDNLVETSNNVARVIVADGLIKILCLTRSSVESSKLDLVNQLKCTFELMGACVETSGDYPGWTPNPDSKILKVISGTYASLFGDQPDVVACHAGLECGIIAGQYPHLDMVSFGPTILGAHSPDERVCISSVSKFWKLLVQTLKGIK